MERPRLAASVLAALAFAATAPAQRYSPDLSPKADRALQPGFSGLV